MTNLSVQYALQDKFTIFAKYDLKYFLTYVIYSITRNHLMTRHYQLELGTRDNCCVNLTPFYAQKVVICCITAKYIFSLLQRTTIFFLYFSVSTTSLVAKNVAHAQLCYKPSVWPRFSAECAAYRPKIFLRGQVVLGFSRCTPHTSPQKKDLNRRQGKGHHVRLGTESLPRKLFCLGLFETNGRVQLSPLPRQLFCLDLF